MNTEDFEDTVEALADDASVHARRSVDAAKDATAQAQDHLQDAWQYGSDALRQGEKYTRENPVPVVLGALALGFVLGALLTRREEPSFHDRYIEEPLSQARKLALAALTPVAEQLQKHYARAERAGDKFVNDDAPGFFDSLTKDIRKAAKKLHLF